MDYTQYQKEVRVGRGNKKVHEITELFLTKDCNFGAKHLGTYESHNFADI